MADPIRFTFCSPQQQAFVLDSTSPSLLYSGAFAAGKSMGISLKTLDTTSRFPGCRVGLFRKTRRSLMATTLRTLQRVLPRQWIRKFHKGDLIWELKNGSLIEGYGLDDPDKIGSLELTDAYVDEIVDTTLDDWVMLQFRVGRWPDGGKPTGQVAGATNPGTPTHYLYDWFFRKGQGRVIETQLSDNALLPKSVAARAEHFVGQYYDRYIRGRWISMEGLIYEEYGPHNLFDPSELWAASGGLPPADWTRYGAIDFGFVNPFVHLWAAESPDGRLYVYREIYMTNRIVEIHAKQIEDLERLPPGPQGEPRSEDVLVRWADHDAEDRATLNHHDIPTRAAKKEVSPGLQAVKRYLRPDEAGLPRLMFARNMLVEQDPRLVANNRPTSLLDEIQGYAFAEPSKSGQPDKDAPRKINDHAMDAMRYLVMGFDSMPTTAPFAFIGGTG